MNLKNPPITLLLAAVIACAPLAVAQTPTEITVVEGQDAKNDIETGVGAPIVIELRDASGAPVPRAQVTFRTPADGPSATFFGASHVSKAWTDEQGRAQASSLTPNLIPGDYTIAVEAGEVTAEVRQTNVGPAPPEQKKKRRFGPKIWIPIAVGIVIVIVGLAQGD